ncbi:hypothetical protein Sango_3052400 [Sesamum angolense]|uniref:CCHC-type domain-containing protein n=1 Tax=Sesamum angolense TaxID=2727404 RepID=A0AAE1T971_9LAMI|nr:hypothetical protein Sango_3052400 [Sesamum angolense]
MEEIVIEDKKKGEEKRKLTYAVEESSRSTKKGTSRSFSARGGNFSRCGFIFRGNSGPRFGGSMGFNRGSLERSSFTMPSIRSGRGVGQSYGRGPVFIPSCSTCGRQHLGPCCRRDDIARICYHCGGREHIARNCPSHTIGVVRSAASRTQSQSSVGSSGRGAERGRGRGRCRDTGNRDSDHAIGSSMRGVEAQITQGQTQEIDFTIETLPGVALISIEPYKIAPMELQELKKQIEELSEKGFITSSTSPWGAPVLFGHVISVQQSFDELKKRLTSTPILVLPSSSGGYVVYMDAYKQGLGCVLMQNEKKELNLRQRRLIELLTDHDCTVDFHQGKANVVASRCLE